MHYANGREARNGDKVVLFSAYAAPVDGGLKVSIEDDQLVARISVDVLAYAALHSDMAYEEGERCVTIPDIRNFADVVCSELQREVGEDGSTLLTLAIDKAFEKAFEHPDAVRFEDDDKALERI